MNKDDIPPGFVKILDSDVDTEELKRRIKSVSINAEDVKIRGTDEERGERLVEVSRPALTWALLRDGPARETDLPDDVELEELWHHNDGWGYVLRVSSEAWDPLDEGEPIPKVEVTVTDVVCE